jgi:3-oxoadipate enol-lactonase
VLIEANGITFNCAVDGPAGAPWVVFSNSLMTDLSMWDAQAEALSEHFRVFRYDQRGHGKTEATDGGYDFNLLIGDLVALYDAVGIDRAHLVGISMGGMTAMGMAERHARRLGRLVVADARGKSSVPAAEAWRARIAIAEAEGMEALVEDTIRRWFPAETIAARPAHLDRVREMIGATTVRGFAGCAMALCDFDFESEISTIEAPTLFIVGSRDGVLPAAMARLAEQVPGACLRELAGAGHLSNLDAPAEFSSALLEFLTKEGD